MAVSEIPAHLAPNTAPPSARDQVLTFVLVPLGSIRPSPLNPRKRFDEAALRELADSLRQHGMLEPVVVRPDPEQTDHGPQRYLLIAGERRWRAAALAGLQRIPARVLPDVTNDSQALELTLIENLQRQDLDAIEEARGYRALAELGWKQAAIAKAVNRSQPTIANAIRLLKLPEDVLDRIQAGKLSPSHGVALVRFADFPAVASKLAEWTVGNHWSSKELEIGIPANWQLVQDGLIRNLSMAQFDTAVCEACPFDARRKADARWGLGLCFKTEHFDELQGAAFEARLEREHAAREVAAAAAKTSAVQGSVAPTAPQDVESPAPAPSLPKLSQIRAHRFGETERRPEGCTPEGCPCAGKALDYKDQVVDVCTDEPGRLLQLKSRDTRKQNKLGRAVLAEKLTQLETALDTLQGIDWKDPLDSRALAILVAAATEGRRREEPITKAIERHAKGLLTERGLTGYGVDPTYQQLGLLPPRELLRLGLEWILRHEIAARWDGPAYGGTQTPQTDWLLAKHGSPSADVPDLQPADLQVDDNDQAPDVERCRVCGCTDEDGCEGGCSWVGESLCSACARSTTVASDA
jgi:ParB/RepB/Spo0J family partition protein